MYQILRNKFPFFAESAPMERVLPGGRFLDFSARIVLFSADRGSRIPFGHRHLLRSAAPLTVALLPCLFEPFLKQRPWPRGMLRARLPLVPGIASTFREVGRRPVGRRFRLLRRYSDLGSLEAALDVAEEGSASVDVRRVLAMIDVEPTHAPSALAVAPDPFELRYSSLTFGDVVDRSGDSPPRSTQCAR